MPTPQPAPDAFNEPVGGWTPFPSKVEYVGGVAVIAPFVVTFESYNVVNGNLESYSNTPATVGGAVAVLCALFALTLLKRTVPFAKTKRVIAVVVLLAAGGFHIASGQGLFFETPQMGTSSNHFQTPMTAPVPAATPKELERAVNEATAACDSDVKTCPRALELATSLCDSHPNVGCDELSLFLMEYRENGGEPDYAAAAAAAQKGCAADNLDACANAAALLFDGKGITQDKARAIELTERACSGGVGNACKNLGWLSGNDESNLARAREFYGKACELNDSDGCRMYAFYLGEGKGGPIDKAQSLLIAAKGCDLGHPIACANLAVYHGKDYPAVLDANRRACELDHGVACKQAALQIAEGLGVEADAVLALSLLRKSCTLDVAEGCGYLGKSLLEGLGTEKNPTEARAAFARSCELGDKEACPFAQAE